MRLIQLSDMHLLEDPEGRVRGSHPDQHTRDVLALLPELAPDRVVVVGDIAQEGHRTAYQRAQHYLDGYGYPWSWLPGNKDIEPTMSGVVSLASVIDMGVAALVHLDTHINEIGNEAGHLGEARLEALDDTLSSLEMPVYIAMHHPPGVSPSRWMKAVALDDSDAFWAVVARHPQVQAVLCGHIHCAIDTSHQGVRVLTSPGIVDQFTPGEDTFTLDSTLRPGLRVIDITPEGQIASTWIVRTS